MPRSGKRSHGGGRGRGEIAPSLLLALAVLVAVAPSLAEARRRGAPRPARPAAAADLELQLLTFEHAWRRIGETYHDSGMKGLDWEGIREELLPRARRARTPADLRPVLRDLVGRLGESHFEVIPGDAYARLEAVTASREGGADEEAGARSGPGDVGLDVRLLAAAGGWVAVVTRVEPGSPAELSGIRPGWILEAVDGERVEATVAAAHGAVARELLARHHAWGAIRRQLGGRVGSSVELTMLHAGGGRAVIQVERGVPSGEVVRIGQLPPLRLEFEQGVVAGPEGITAGVVRFSPFMAPLAAPFGEAVADFVRRRVDGVVVDLRGNPGGFGAMVMGMAGHFIGETGVSLGTMSLRAGDLRFVVNPRFGVNLHRGPVAVLVDELSASTSELLAGGLQSVGRARVFGTVTAGMALPSVIELLPNGDRMQFALADLVTADGTRLEGRGVVPDEPVELTREALLQGRDLALEAALAWIAAARDPS